MRARTSVATTAALLLLLAGAGCAGTPAAQGPAAVPPAPLPAVGQVSVPRSEAPPTNAPSAPPVPAKTVAALGDPLPGAFARVTKKTFGLKVSPGHSPVTPERFSGYHCGVDFETTPEEQDADLAVSAVCDGPLLLKKWATGYGGVAVQGCTLDGRDVTVVYGHLRLASVAAKTGDLIVRGARLGVLGKGYSTETDGERKHLHLGIHVGKAVDIRGYVQTSAGLTDWLDAAKYLRH